MFPSTGVQVFVLAEPGLSTILCQLVSKRGGLGLGLGWGWGGWRLGWGGWMEVGIECVVLHMRNKCMSDNSGNPNATPHYNAAV